MKKTEDPNRAKATVHYVSNEPPTPLTKASKKLEFSLREYKESLELLALATKRATAATDAFKAAKVRVEKKIRFYREGK